MFYDLSDIFNSFPTLKPVKVNKILYKEFLYLVGMHIDKSLPLNPKNNCGILSHILFGS